MALVAQDEYIRAHCKRSLELLSRSSNDCNLGEETVTSFESINLSLWNTRVEYQAEERRLRGGTATDVLLSILSTESIDYNFINNLSSEFF